MRLSFGRRPSAPRDLWAGYASDALQLAEAVDLDLEVASRTCAASPPFVWRPGRMSCNWFFQEVGAVKVGGLMTAFRIAAQLRTKGVHQRFLICGPADLKDVSRRVIGAFPELDGAEFITLDSEAKLKNVPAADIGVATLWTTAFVLAAAPACARRMYLIQDLEPLFYPAGSTSAQAELSYRLGFEAIANTAPLGQLYRDRYGGPVVSFTPQIDRRVFYPGSGARWPRARVFFYARPGNPRNAFELGAAALKRLKARFGSSVEILCAGAEFDPAQYGLKGVVEPLGWLPYEQTGELYRTCHVGLASMVTPHPSYLPFELMACGATVVALRNDTNGWLLEDGQTALIAEPTATSLADRLFTAVAGWSDQEPLRARAAQRVELLCGRGWAAELAPVVDYMIRPADADVAAGNERVGWPRHTRAALSKSALTKAAL